MSNNAVIMPDDYKDLIYKITYPLLGKLAPRIPNSIAPNQITIAAFISTLIAAALLYFVQSPMAFIYWALFNAIWYVLDALDGIHARLTGQCSEYGAFLDHAFDNISFIFTFTVFAIKFDLLHPFYIFILLSRFTAATMVFTMQCHTNRLYLSKFSGGFEFLLMTIVMLLSYAFPHFNPAMHTNNSFLLHWIDLLNLQQGLFMKLTLLIYLIGVPITFYLQFKFVKKELKT